ncbi:MAG: 2-amino-4-hydroxy-6-hydroxymethyldihydropteridine diphosphokinase [Flavobacteriales bacterium]
MGPMHKAYLCTGSNLGDSRSTLEEVISFIHFNMGDVLAQSAVYRSPAWGMVNAPDFYNQVIVISTELTPAQLIQEISELEEFFGRERTPGIVDSRTLDVDLLLYDDLHHVAECIEVPHPRLHLRRFVLIPLAEVAAEILHPTLKKTVRELLTACVDQATVVRVD